MAILFAISVVAFLALIWAFIATARHIRRARRRRKLSAAFVPTPSPPSYAPSNRTEALPVTVTFAEATPPPPPAIEALVPVTPATIRFPLSSQRRAAESSAANVIAATPLTSISGLSSLAERRPPMSVPTPDPDSRRPDWAYFNKDMGDLSDPAPSPRFKDRTRAR